MSTSLGRPVPVRHARLGEGFFVRLISAAHGEGHVPEEGFERLTARLEPGGAELTLELAASAGEDAEPGTAWVCTFHTPRAFRGEGHARTLVRWLLGRRDVGHVELGALTADGRAFLRVWQEEARRAGKTVSSLDLA